MPQTYTYILFNGALARDVAYRLVLKFTYVPSDLRALAGTPPPTTGQTWPRGVQKQGN